MPSFLTKHQSGVLVLESERAPWGDPRISHHDCESSLCRTAGIFGVSPKKGYLFAGPYNQDYSTVFAKQGACSREALKQGLGAAYGWNLTCVGHSQDHGHGSCRSRISI